MENERVICIFVWGVVYGVSDLLRVGVCDEEDSHVCLVAGGYNLGPFDCFMGLGLQGECQPNVVLVV